MSGEHCATCSCVLSDIDEDAVGQHHKNPRDTEKDGAYDVMPRTGTQRRKVFNAFVAAFPEGLTHYEVSDKTGVYYNSCVPRRRELVKGGWLVDSGDRRPGPFGSTGIVWILSARAQEEFT